MGLYSIDFREAFSKLLGKAGASCYMVSQYSHLDEAYLSRLRRGEKDNPSPETIVKISLALVHLSADISLYDIEGLFKAVGRSMLLKR